MINICRNLVVMHSVAMAWNDGKWVAMNSKREQIACERMVTPNDAV